MTAETLLSENFVEFSSKITALHEKKKELNADFKKMVENHKANLKSIDEEAVNLEKAFTDWQQSHEESKKVKS